MLVKKSKNFMNSTFTISSYDEAPHALLDEAFFLIENFESKYTVFKESYFNQINKLAGISEVKIDAQTFQILELCQKFFEISKGSFDICFENPKYNFLDLKINQDKSTIYLPYKDMKINLGGIGKGFCVDLIFDFLKSKGLKNFCVNGGGDMRVSSQKNAPRPWRIGITNPFNPKNVVGHVTLTNHSLATSGTYLKGQHIQTTSTSEIISLSVMSEDCVSADVLATIGMTMNKDEALRFFDAKNIWATLICQDGSVHLTRRAYNTHMGHAHKGEAQP